MLKYFLFGLFQIQVMLFEQHSGSEMLHGSLQCSIDNFIASSNKFVSSLRRPMPQSFYLPTRLQSSHQCWQRPTSYISYIIPYDQPQVCNIYGPLFQADSMTVGVSLTTTTSNNVLPCSSYLPAQTKYLTSAAVGGAGLDSAPEEVDSMSDDWLFSCDHSPKCRS